MSMSPRRGVAVAALGWALAATAHGQSGYPGIGRAATASEVAAWDIDVRPDFKGLPPGSGSVAGGLELWEARCASCHGVFGESNQVFSALVGGTTAQDIQTGRVARLTDRAYPGRSTLMKLSRLSTLWDYIRRAMPWDAPKSLTVDEVYAVTAYLLNLGGIVPDDLTLSDRNIAQIEQRLPNRNGLTTNHGLWPGKGMGNGGKPDVKALACMHGCSTEPTLSSSLPDFARNEHGNLAEQGRMVGAQLGADTSLPPGAAAITALARQSPARTAAPVAAPDGPALALAKANNCMACHALDSKLVGPALREVARKYAGRSDAAAYLALKIQNGGAGLWGPIPMPAQTLSPDDAKIIAVWLAGGARQ